MIIGVICILVIIDFVFFDLFFYFFYGYMLWEKWFDSILFNNYCRNEILLCVCKELGYKIENICY